jgi:hypothetical protein
VEEIDTPLPKLPIVQSESSADAFPAPNAVANDPAAVEIVAPPPKSPTVHVEKLAAASPAPNAEAWEVAAEADDEIVAWPAKLPIVHSGNAAEELAWPAPNALAWDPADADTAAWPLKLPIVHPLDGVAEVALALPIPNAAAWEAAAVAVAEMVTGPPKLPIFQSPNWAVVSPAPNAAAEDPPVAEILMGDPDVAVKSPTCVLEKDAADFPAPNAAAWEVAAVAVAEMVTGPPKLPIFQSPNWAAAAVVSPAPNAAAEDPPVAEI